MDPTAGNARPFPEPEIDPLTGRLIYRMGALDQFALLPEIPPGAKVSIRVELSDRAIRAVGSAAAPGSCSEQPWVLQHVRVASAT